MVVTEVPATYQQMGIQEAKISSHVDALGAKILEVEILCLAGSHKININTYAPH